MSNSASHQRAPVCKWHPHMPASCVRRYDGDDEGVLLCAHCKNADQVSGNAVMYLATYHPIGEPLVSVERVERSPEPTSS